MIERNHRFGRLVFDRDAIVRAALRAYVEAVLARNRFRRLTLSFPVCDVPGWTGDLQRGAFYNGDGCGGYEVVAWTETGVVGLAYELGFGPIEQLGLSVDAVTRGPDDVRAALPGLPAALESALVMATGMLYRGGVHGEKLAGVGFWLHGDRVAGTLFDHPQDAGARQLSAWGLLQNGRLPGMWEPRTAVKAAELARTRDAAMHALIDAVVDRRMQGTTELTTEEIEMLFQSPPDPGQMLGAQHRLREVGITWPGSPELPPETPRPRINRFTRHPYVCPEHFEHLIECFGPVVFNRDAIVRAALRAYVETILAPLDPLARHVLTACVVPKWTGDLQRGAFSNGDGCGDYDVVAWTEAGVVGLAYKRGWGPIQQLSLSASVVTGGPDDVRAALPGLPDELLPALEMATGLLEVGAHGEKLAGVGFWLQGDRAAGTLFDDPTLVGARRLIPWGALKKDRLPLLGDRKIAALAAALARTTAAPIHALVDAVTDRALDGPTELLPDELATLFPTPPDAEERLFAQRMLERVGITWPGLPELDEEPRGAGRSPFMASPRAIGRTHPLGYLAFDRDAIARAALRAYVEVVLAYLDPLDRYEFTPRLVPNWTGDLQRGAFSSGTHGEHDVVAWTEAGVLGLAYRHGFSPPELLGLSASAVTGGPDDLRAALPGLPDELWPAFEMAVGLLKPGFVHGDKLAGVGFWLHGGRVAGTLFDTPTAHGVWRLACWGRVGRGRLLPQHDPRYATTVTEDTLRTIAPIRAIVDAITARALVGPTELLPDEIAMILPKPPLRPHDVLTAQRRLQKVGINWPGSPEIPEAPGHVSTL
jgi:hypothetical protein